MIVIEISPSVTQIDPPVKDIYNNWFNTFKQKSLELDIPFTGLGYTYNWSVDNPSETTGISEYIIKPGSEVIIASILSLKDYLQK